MMAPSAEPIGAPAAAGPQARVLVDGAATIAGLDIVAELGRGAQAVVYRVRREDAEFALKLLHASAGGSRAAASAFRRQAGLVACVNHAAVTQVYEVGDLGERLYLVMDLAEGWPLNRLLEAGPLDPGRAVALGVDLAGALAAAHRVGVVHRDVKPQNIVVSSDGQARLIDFGLAIQPAGEMSVDSIAGTVAYASPEQTGMLKRPVDGRADLYSLGVVLFECLTGERPFNADDPGELIRLHVTAPAPEVAKLRPEVPPALSDLVAKLLAKDPDDRYQTGDGLLADLRRIDRNLALGGVAGSRVGLSFTLGLDDRLAGAARRPLVGRRVELSRLTELWSQVATGSGAVAVIEGALGIGKTRLVEEFLDGQAAAGTPILQARCATGDPVPMAALRTAVERYLYELERLDPERRAIGTERLRTAAGSAAALLGPLSPTLASLLHLGRGAETGPADGLTTAVASFLTGLARAAGGLVIHLDNAGALDPASQRVIRQVTAELGTVPLLLICTGPADPDDGAGPGWLAGNDLTIGARLTVGPLTDLEVARLAQAQLGGNALAEALEAELVARVRGNPGVLLEYLRAMVEEGAVLPDWGTWRLDAPALTRLALSADVKDLMTRRLDGLVGAAYDIITAAAAIPLPFSLSLLVTICDVEINRVTDAIQQAISLGVIASRPGGAYVFLHDLLHEALLSGLTGEERRLLHLRVAWAFELTGLTGPAITYATAREYALGDPEHTSPRMFRACYRAAQVALREDAAPEAADFLDLARHTAEHTGVALDSAFHRYAGRTALRLGRYDEAREHLALALAREPDPVGRAELLGIVAQTYRGEYRSAECVAAVQQALREIKAELPAGRVALTRSTIRRFAAGVRIGLSRPGRRFGTADGADLRRYRLQVRLLHLGSAGASMGMNTGLAVAFCLRALYPANRIGASMESIRLRATLGVLADAAGWRRRGARMFRSAGHLADLSGEPGLVAYVARMGAITTDLGHGVQGTSGSAIIRMLQEYGRWLEPDEYLESVAALGSILMLRGYAREAMVWSDRGQSRVAAGARVLGTPFAMVRALAAGALGRVAEANAELAAIREYVEAGDGGREQRVNVLIVTMHSALEQGEFGTDFDDAVTQVAQLRLPTGRNQLWSPYQIVWVYLAFARLAQARLADGDPRTQRLRQARTALDQLRRAANTPVLRAHHDCAYASYLVLTGDHDAALTRLAQAERLGHLLDLPWLSAEIATVRARALGLAGQDAESRRQAKLAYVLAAEYQWHQRARALRLEFDITAPVTLADQSHTSMLSNSIGGPYQRRLAALQEVSLAAATILDPNELARVALDEVIRILGAERAILFLTEADTDELRPFLGRDATGNDLAELTGYGSTLVDRVRRTQEPLVITGSEQGAALGSESVVIHGLRSIMVAPLQLKGRLLGVVYLDNRVAKGVFTVGDVDILAAITHLVAASLETARAAQLELAVHAAQQQRDLADMMRDATVEVGSTLEPDEVLTRLVGTLKRVLASDVAYLLRPGPNGWLADAFTTSIEPVVPADVELPDPILVGNQAVATMVAATTGTTQDLPRPLAVALSATHCWLAIALAARDAQVGVLVIGSRTLTGYDEAQSTIAAALAGQGMIAYDNALLFKRVEQLATIDSLSGINNRRYFFELANRHVDMAMRQGRPLSAAMLDIDHFKRINDTHGHSVGDEVIRTVATRINDNLRSFDILGRYGGEEFALVLPEVEDEIDEIAERLREAVAATPVATAAGPVPVTISVGVTRSQDADDVDSLLVRADKALYQAKEGGRNRVAHA